MSIPRRNLLCGLSLSALAPDLLIALQHVHNAAPSNAPPAFDAPDARDIEALAAGILPSGKTAGAREARVIDFIQRALSTIYADQRPVYVKGLADVRAKVAPKGLADLTAAEMEALLHSIETTEFFNVLRTHTLTGYLAHPSWGGNRNELGWKAIGFEDKHAFQPPFGYYDDPNAR